MLLVNKVYNVTDEKSRYEDYNVYKRGGQIMKTKKNIVITFRTDEETKKSLDQMAAEKEWSISQVVEKICKEYFKQQKQEQK